MTGVRELALVSTTGRWHGHPCAMPAVLVGNPVPDKAPARVDDSANVGIFGAAPQLFCAACTKQWSLWLCRPLFERCHAAERRLPAGTPVMWLLLPRPRSSAVERVSRQPSTNLASVSSAATPFPHTYPHTHTPRCSPHTQLPVRQQHG